MKGYFSLVQYCPNIARREAANIGVILLCPEANFLKLKLQSDNNRVRRFFGDQADGDKFLDQMKHALSARIDFLQRDLVIVMALENFISTWTSKVMITAPKPVKVSTFEDVLTTLFTELVDSSEGDFSSGMLRPFPVEGHAKIQ